MLWILFRRAPQACGEQWCLFNPPGWSFPAVPSRSLGAARASWGSADVQDFPAEHCKPRGEHSALVLLQAITLSHLPKVAKIGIPALAGMFTEPWLGSLASKMLLLLMLHNPCI